MTTKRSTLLSIVLGVALAAIASVPASGAPFTFSNGSPDGRMAMASRPAFGGSLEIEAADDFALTGPTTITGATFTGLIPTGAPLTSITKVVVEIYRVFPEDSDQGRTPHVPTRVNSPSDNALASRDSAVAGQLVFVPSVLNSSFSAANSVLNGIHPSPNQMTGGEGSVSGQEVQFNVTFTSPFDLSADHYFFVPQVLLTSGNFYWLSTPRPNPALNPDLQAWIRNFDLDPDWLRVGTDIVGGSTPPTFDAAFDLIGDTVAAVPEPATLFLVGAGVVACGVLRRRGHRER